MKSGKYAALRLPPDLLWKDRLRTALLDIGDTTEAQAQALGVDATTVARWLKRDEGNRPRAEVLLRIVQLSANSGDWINGWDVPRRLNDRVAGGDATVLRQRAEEIADTFGSTMPDGRARLAAVEREAVTAAWRRRLNPLPASPSDLLDEFSRAYFEREILRVARLWQDALRRLAALMVEGSAYSRRDGDLGRALTTQADALHARATRLGSLQGFLNEIDDLEREGPLHSTQRGTGVIVESPFSVLAPSTGLAWRGSGHDEIWYLDSVLVARVRRKGRFLRVTPTLAPMELFLAKPKRKNVRRSRAR